MLRFATFLVLLSLIFMAATCERPVDFDLEAPQTQLVVTSNFTNDKAIEVQVQKSQEALNNQLIEFVGNATVEIYEGDNFIEQLELVVQPKVVPFYRTKEFVPRTNVLYTIEVAVPGFQIVKAQSIIPAQTAIESFGVSNVTQKETSDGVLFNYEVELSFVDPPSEMNYYRLNFYQQIHHFANSEGDTVILGSTLQKIDFSSLNDNNNLTAYFDGGVLFNDEEFDGQRISYSFPFQTQIDPENQLIGNLVAELLTVSEEYFLYHISLSRQLNQSGAVLNEPVFVFNNIKNGKGIFAGYSVASQSISIVK